MAFKLIEATQNPWRAVNTPHLVAVVRAGARFERGKLVERETRRGQRGISLKDLHQQVLNDCSPVVCCSPVEPLQGLHVRRQQGGALSAHRAYALRMPHWPGHIGEPV